MCGGQAVYTVDPTYSTVDHSHQLFPPPPPMSQDGAAGCATALLGVLSVEEAYSIVAHCPPPRPLLSLWGMFNFNAVGDGDCRFNFRFWRNDIERLYRALGLATVYTLPARLTVTEMEGLCEMLRRLAYPGRYGVLAVISGQSPTALCMIFRFMVDLLYSRFSCLLTLESGILTGERCTLYVEAVAGKAAPSGDALVLLTARCELLRDQRRISGSGITDTNENTR